MEAGREQKRRQRRRVVAALYLMFLLLLFIGVAELALRIAGWRPYKPVDLQIQIEPGGRLFKEHPRLGYTQIPGHFKVTLPDGYTFRLTHLTNTLRATHPEGVGVRSNRPGLWVMGCSFVHGWSLNDEETFPWLLQQAFPEYEVSNFGVNGYGTLHSLLQFREFSMQLPKPACVVVDYAYFHDSRNTLTRARLKEVAPYNKLGPIKLPRARLDAKGGLQIEQTPVEYHEWPGQRLSSLIHFLEHQYNQLEEHRARGQQVSIAILKEFAAECQKHGIKFIVAGITRGKDTAAVLKACAAEGIATVDISVSLSEPGSRNLPHDDHPSARSQREYARKLGEYLRAGALAGAPAS